MILLTGNCIDALLNEEKRVPVIELNMIFIINLDGDLGPYSNVIDAYMKQKHRMIWERRQALKNNPQE